VGIDLTLDARMHNRRREAESLPIVRQMFDAQHHYLIRAIA
jgi:hypothetical protein